LDKTRYIFRLEGLSEDRLPKTTSKKNPHAMKAVGLFRDRPMLHGFFIHH
jgi:hypothetical protein